MAAQEQSQNQIFDLVRVLRRRVWQVVLPAAVVLTFGSAFAKLLPKKYTAMTELELRESTLPLSGQGMDEKTIQRDVTNTSWQVMQFERVKRVVEKLEWPDYTALSPVEQFDYIRKVQKNVVPTVISPKNLQGSSRIIIKYTDEDAKRSEQFLNRLREAYTSEVLERYRQDARRSLEVLRNNMMLAGDEARDCDELSAKFKKDHGISATQQAPGGGRQRDEDPVYARLQQAKNKLLDVQMQIASDKAGLATLQEQYKSEPLQVPEDLLASSGLSFDDELVKIETEIENLRDSQKGYKDKHTIWITAEDRINKLNEKKAALREKATAPVSQTALRPNARRDVLAKAIQDKELTVRQAEGTAAQLEAEVKELQKEQATRVEIYRQLQDLDRRATTAASILEGRTIEFQRQKSFVDLLNEGSNPFEVTEMARAPTKPDAANGLIVTAAAGVVGLGLGLVWAILSEFGRNGFRGVADTTRALAVPVLGVVNRIVTKSERRAIATRRVLVGVSTVAMVAAILWVSWAYEHRPQVLGHDVVRAINDVKESLR